MLVVAWLLVPTTIAEGSTLNVAPTESLSVVRETTHPRNHKQRVQLPARATD